MWQYYWKNYTLTYPVIYFHWNIILTTLFFCKIIYTVCEYYAFQKYFYYIKKLQIEEQLKWSSLHLNCTRLATVSFGNTWPIKHNFNINNIWFPRIKRNCAVLGWFASTSSIKNWSRLEFCDSNTLTYWPAKFLSKFIMFIQIKN